MFSTEFIDPGGHRGDAMQALAQWRHPMAPSEARDVLYWASLVPFLLNDQIWEKLNYVMCTPVAEESDENFWLNQTATSVLINWPGKSFVCEILGADGQRIETFSSKETAEVSTSQWAQGVYFIKCSNGHEIVVKKVFVR